MEAAIHTHHAEVESTDVFGFWLYIMSDCILFACLFATFLVLHTPGAPGPQLKTWLDLTDVLIETFFLLLSNFTFCLAVLNLYQNKLFKIQFWLGVSFLLGACFIFMELKEFIHLAHEGLDDSLDASGRQAAHTRPLALRRRAAGRRPYWQRVQARSGRAVLKPVCCQRLRGKRRRLERDWRDL